MNPNEGEPAPLIPLQGTRHEDNLTVNQVDTAIVDVADQIQDLSELGSDMSAFPDGEGFTFSLHRS